MEENDLPQGIQLTVLDEAFREDPYPIMKKLRKQAPVFHDTQLNQYVFSRYDDVKAILRDADYWSDPRKANPGTFMRDVLAPGISEDGQPSMLMMDEPDHRRLRSLVSSSFTPSAVERWRPRTREIVGRLLDKIDANEFDLIREFAGPVPAIVIAELMGIGSDKHDEFKAWSDDFADGVFSPFPTEEELVTQERAAEQLDSFFKNEIAIRRENPGDDLLSDMIRAEEQGDRLTEDEIVTQCELLLVAGNVTTTDLIGNGVKALMSNRDQWDKLREQPVLVSNAVEEMLRFDSPVTNSGRIANRDVEYEGCPIGRGNTLATSLAAANHDPDVYDEPARFNIERQDIRHQSFGGGRHLCLGAHLARIEAQEAILGLIEKFPELKASDKGFVYRANPSFRGMSEYWVKTK